MGGGVKIRKLMYFFKNVLLCFGGHGSVYSDDDQGRVYQNCKIHDPRTGLLVLECGHISNYNEFVLSSTLSILIAYVLRIMMLLSYTIVGFYFFYDWAVDMQI